MKAAHLEITTDSPDIVLFHTSCVCGSPRHTLTVLVEKSSDPSTGAEMSLCFEVGSIEKDNAKWHEKFLSRLKRALRILCMGNIWLEDCFIFRSAEHTREFIAAMQEAVDQVNSHEKTDGGASVSEHTRAQQLP